MLGLMGKFSTDRRVISSLSLITRTVNKNLEHLTFIRAIRPSLNKVGNLMPNQFLWQER